MKVQLWHRRHALMIASQLPEDPNDALAVFGAAMDVVREFLAGKQDEPETAEKPTLTVISIGGSPSVP
jgi:hypothetical protein